MDLTIEVKDGNKSVKVEITEVVDIGVNTIPSIIETSFKKLGENKND